VTKFDFHQSIRGTEERNLVYIEDKDEDNESRSNTGTGVYSEIADQINCIPCLAANPQISTTHKMNQIYKNNQIMEYFTAWVIQV
jgi:hypothetical protein